MCPVAFWGRIWQLKAVLSLLIESSLLLAVLVFVSEEEKGNLPKDNLPAVVPEVPEEWGLSSPKRKAQVEKAQTAGALKHGILATIPMVCRDYACPYKAHCLYQQRGEVTAGERCVLEIGKLIRAADQYYAEFGVDPTDPDQRVDAVLIQQLLTLEILLDRCNMLLATGNLVEDIDVAMNPNGDVISQPQLHKAAEALPKLQRRQNEILTLLSATRKDKFAQAATIGMSIDQWTKQMLDRAQMVDARLAHLRAGDRKIAEDMGIQYALEAHQIDDDIIDVEVEDPSSDQE